MKILTSNIQFSNLINKSILFCSLFAFHFSFIKAQTAAPLPEKKLIISSIKIIGNFKTKSSIIYRELTFKKGDTVSPLRWVDDTLRSRNNLMNTGLFNFVNIDTEKNNSYQPNPNHYVNVNAIISVQEQWYIIPVPIFQIEERNFNVWWSQDHRSLDKIDYGLSFTNNNNRGRKEILKILLQLGYTIQYGVSYTIPYLTKNQDFGLQFYFASSQNKEIAYTSVNDVLTFLNTPLAPLQQQYTARIDLTYRQGFYDYHYLELNFAACYVNDTILKVTTDYLPYNLTSTAYFGAKYYFKRDLRNNVFYPLTGYYVDFSLNDYGLGMAIPKERAFNILYGQSSIHKYWKLADNLYYSAEAEGKVSQSGSQPYYIQRGLGYGNDFVRGYELYVIDGNNWGLAKNEIKYRLFNVPVKQVHITGLKQFDKAYYAAYFTLFTDWGYVGDADPYVLNNFLANTPLWGYGAGIDLVMYYNIVVRFEYSFNQLNQNGFFLHFQADM